MESNEDILNSPFNPDIELTPVERVDLASVVAMPGFTVIRKLIKASIDHIGLNLLNTPSSDRERVITNHISWKVAAQIYTVFINIINRESEKFSASVAARNSKIIDPIGEELDFGDTLENKEEFF
jgi:hypothetical protein